MIEVDRSQVTAVSAGETSLAAVFADSSRVFPTEIDDEFRFFDGLPEYPYNKYLLGDCPGAEIVQNGYGDENRYFNQVHQFSNVGEDVEGNFFFSDPFYGTWYDGRTKSYSLIIHDVSYLIIMIGSAYSAIEAGSPFRVISDNLVNLDLTRLLLPEGGSLILSRCPALKRVRMTSALFANIQTGSQTAIPQGVQIIIKDYE